MAECLECGDDFRLEDGYEDDGMCHQCAHAIAEGRISAAYERGVRDAAEEAGTFVRDVAVKPVLANACRLRILALLDKKGAGDEPL